MTWFSAGNTEFCNGSLFPFLIACTEAKSKCVLIYFIIIDSCVLNHSVILFLALVYTPTHDSCFLLHLFLYCIIFFCLVVGT